MALTGNKGEWSEIYTLFKLLGDGKVYAGDSDMSRLNLYYPILNIIREESKRYEYQPNQEQNIVVISEDGEEYARISMDRFMSESAFLLDAIRTANDRSFSVPHTEEFMTDIKCSKLKAQSRDKADIHIVIHDLRTNMTPLLGFSIKSQLGSPSTLLNAGEPTNILYKVEGVELSDEDILRINSIPGHLPRMEALWNTGANIVYSNIENETFRNNLLFLDTCMPQFVAICLAIESHRGSLSAVKEVVEHVAQINPFGFSGTNILSFYEHKMKVLLLDTALGMTPASTWTGRYDANGGYLVVKRDGEIVCYHFYNRNDIEDYLYNNTRFERASRSRYHFGSLFRDSSGQVCIKLNLQIRFAQ